MDPERNPQLADILRRLKNPSGTGTERPVITAPVAGAVPDPVILGTKSSSQIDKPLVTTDPRRRPAISSVDPSKITTWTAAQKYVIDHIYSNQAHASRIKQLIKHQQNQERQWWADREALISKHRGRVEKEKQVAAMLQSMGGVVAPTKASNSDEEEAELRNCDLKIHKAMTRLAMDIDRELRAMGVPFYAIKHELVILEERKGAGVQPEKVDKSELRELQKRMLQLLEELFKE